MRCSSYCTADSYRIDDLARYLRSAGYEPKFYDDVIHIRKSSVENEGDAFFFPYGCVITWGFSEEEDERILEELEPYQHIPLKHPTHDDSTNYFIGPETKINEEDDEVIIANDDPLIKLSMSHALSQSVKLNTFEISTDKTIEKTRFLPNELAIKGKISMSRRKLSQQLGQLFAERNSVNLHTDILDTPEFFWRRPRYEPYYVMATEYLDITTRMNILNRRLDVIHELYEILSNELNHRHSSRLEWVIISLIVIEVLIAFFRDILKWI
ncbi:MAG: RMD1 family protein [Alphaproteobacteria bacterium]